MNEQQSHENDGATPWREMIVGRFPLGNLAITPNAHERLPMDDVLRCLCRHAVGDWGDVCAEDQAANELALRDGSRLLSAFRSGDEKFWIITEADRSVTTVLLPEDY